MTEIRCPKCGVELMEHEAGRCLDEWVADGIARSTGQPLPPVIWRRYSEDVAAAYALMEKVWEMNNLAAVGIDTIAIIPRFSSRHRDIEGPTFPLRVCRAFLWLKNQAR